MRSIDLELSFDPDDWPDIRRRALECQANQAEWLDRLLKSDLMKAEPIIIVKPPTIRELLGVKQPCKRVRFDWREIRINAMQRKAGPSQKLWRDEWIDLGLLTELCRETV